MSAADAQAYQGAAGAAFAPVAAQVPGMWVGVWQPEQGRTSFALGEAVKPGTAAQAGDVGRIGSLTKTFTATAVLQQVERGTLALDDTIADVLPELAATYPDIAAVTVRQLLNMSSGLPDYTADADFWREFLTDPTRVWTLDDVLTVALVKPASAAGTPAYCNTNYIVLGAMLEKVTGKTASEIVNAVVEQAGLGRTALTPPPDNAMPNPHSNGYLSPTIAAQFTSLGATIPPNNDVTNWTVSMSGTAGAMYSTVDDLLTWAGTGMGTSMLTPAMADARLTDTSELAPGEFYGLGIGITDRWLAHSGAINGWMSDMRVDRRTGAVVVTLVNIEGGLEPAKPVIDAMVAQLDVGQG
ncbi:MAG: D-alanyl-D-alanine carboxypeptidase [Actinomycetota bacterium]|nr:D-alanyl-D-alanine carboxypeptidase [Actinomycetota bacterium]